jgi:hypothetical protein
VIASSVSVSDGLYARFKLLDLTIQHDIAGLPEAHEDSLSSAQGRLGLD